MCGFLVVHHTIRAVCQAMIDEDKVVSCPTTELDVKHVTYQTTQERQVFLLQLQEVSHHCLAGTS